MALFWVRQIRCYSLATNTVKNIKDFQKSAQAHMHMRECTQKAEAIWQRTPEIFPCPPMYLEETN